VAEARDGQQEGRVEHEFLALREDRLGEARVLLLASEVGDLGRDLLRPLAGREIGQVGLAALGLGDDRAGHADDVVGPQVDPLPDHRRQVVAGADLGAALDREQLHTPLSGDAGKGPR